MPANTPEQWRLTELNQSIERLEAESARLAAERAALAKASLRGARRLYYLRMARAVRAPAASFELWPIGLLVAGSFFVGFLLLTVVSIATHSNAAGFLALLVGAAVAALG